MSLKILVPVALSTIGCAASAYSKPGVLTPSDQKAVGLIQDALRKEHGYGPEKIFRYLYKGKVAYLAVAPCCDHFNILYDEKAKPICSPTGGFTGRGDGTCNDFSEKKSAETLVFEGEPRGIPAGK